MGADRSSTVRLDDHRLVVGALRARRMVASPPPSKRTRFLLTGGWSVLSPTARNFLTRPPTGTPRRAIGPGEGILRPSIA